MKLTCIAAVALLVLALCSPGQSQNGGLDECCMSYYSKTIPPRAIKDYKQTNPSCPKKGVILITVKEKKICANPDEKPVQDIVSNLDFGPITSSR